MGSSAPGVIERIVAWASRRPDVRAAVLTSSRARPGAGIDTLSDFDVVLASRLPELYRPNDWTFDAYGPLLVSLAPEPDAQPTGRFSRLAIYRDGTKIDWTVWSVAALTTALEGSSLPPSFDVGYEVLFDLDGLFVTVPPPTYAVYLPSPPTADDFRALVNEFWWETTYVAKNLWRGELMAARYSFDVVIRHELLRRMLEWRIEIAHDWAIAPGRDGRYLAGRLDAATRRELEATYAGAPLEENWRALWAATGLFGRVGRDVGTALGYAYQDDLERDVTKYLRSIEVLPK